MTFRVGGQKWVPPHKKKFPSESPESDNDEAVFITPLFCASLQSTDSPVSSRSLKALSPRTTAARTIVQREGTPYPAPAAVRQYHRSGGTAEPLPLAALMLDSDPLLRCPRMVER